VAASIAKKGAFERNFGRRRPRWSSNLSSRGTDRLPEAANEDRPPYEDATGGAGSASMRSCRNEEAIVLCDGVIDLVCAFFNVPTRELRRSGRSSLEIAQIRQIAMYVAHVVLRLTMKQVGVGFERDRTTVVHACHIVEDMRDDDEIDRIVSHVERIVVAAFHIRRNY
jgi:hypothetical protein